MSRGIGAFQRKIMDLLNEPGVFWPEDAVWPEDAASDTDDSGYERGHRALPITELAYELFVHGDKQWADRTDQEQTRRALNSLMLRGLVRSVWALNENETQRPRVRLFYSVHAQQQWPKIWLYKGYLVRSDRPRPSAPPIVTESISYDQRVREIVDARIQEWRSMNTSALSDLEEGHLNALIYGRRSHVLNEMMKEYVDDNHMLMAILTTMNVMGR